MDCSGLTLLVPDKPDVERDALAGAWAAAGGEVLRLARFWDPPALDPARVRVYGSDSFCLVLQQKIGFELCSPPGDLLFSIPPEFLKRKIERRRLDEAAGLSYPAFVKSVVPKLFASRVYAGFAELESECAGLDGDTGILVSEVVRFVAEARTFVLDGRVLDAAVYEGRADAGAAAAFAADVARAVHLPKAVVVDVGLLDGGGWALVELNAAWGAGLNGCRPDLVLPCVAVASAPSAEGAHRSGM